MTSREILMEVRRWFSNYDYKLFNTYMYAWECDFFAISGSGYAVEVEVKISRSDYLADFKKKDKHVMLASHKNGIVIERGIEHLLYGQPEYGYFDENNRRIWARGSSIYFKDPANHLPNKFYYACPTGLIKVDEVPAYAGLFYFKETTNSAGTHTQLVEMKKAPFLHKVKNDKKHALLQKYYWLNINKNNDIIILNGDLQPHLSDAGKRIFKDFLNKLHFEH